MRQRILKFIVIISGIVAAATLLLLAVVAWIAAQPVPDISLENIERNSAKPSAFYAADGSLLAEWHTEEEREPLPADDIGQTIMDATVAIEDQRFFEHSGVDVRGIARALQRNAGAGGVREGGSTITQQLMKMMYDYDERTLVRKITEAIRATRVEMAWDKRDILSAYLNMAYFGRGSWGIEAAARDWFGLNSPRELTPAQAATLAGVLHAPSSYQPDEAPDEVVARRNVVLSAMLSQNLITRTQYDEAKATPLELVSRVSRNSDLRYPWFVDLVQRQLPKVIDSAVADRGGLRVTTTLDPQLQEAAEVAAKSFQSEKDPTVALVSMRQTDGAVLALIGGKNWSTNQFNVAVQGRRQPGSAFKPVVLAAALDVGIPLSREYDTGAYETPVKDGIWHVDNYDGRAPSARMTLESATVYSVNTVYARLIMDLGPDKVVAQAQALGFAADMDPDPALALGGLKYGVSPLEMTAAYTAMAMGGEYVQPRSITRIEGPNGELLYQAPGVAGTEGTAGEPASVEATRSSALSPKVSKQLQSVLHEVVTRGTGGNAELEGTWTAGKTGTTQSYRDAWFVGWAKGATTAVWMGYPEAQIDMDDVHGRVVTGGSFPAEIWHNYMMAALKVRPMTGLVAAPAPETGSPGTGNIPTLEEIGR
ncbi:MAG: penicillin-binding protein [Actinomycetes bacterium]|jgi:penicillin-binding protein 1A|nr:penicillin-binding protein [Actinomycetes bacterium]